MAKKRGPLSAAHRAAISRSLKSRGGGAAKNPSATWRQMSGTSPRVKKSLSSRYTTKSRTSRRGNGAAKNPNPTWRQLSGNSPRAKKSLSSRYTAKSRTRR